jgi:hypothetical protein
MSETFISNACDAAIFLADTVADAMRILHVYKPAPIHKNGDLADWTTQTPSAERKKRAAQ